MVKHYSKISIVCATLLVSCAHESTTSHQTHINDGELTILSNSHIRSCDKNANNNFSSRVYSYAAGYNQNLLSLLWSAINNVDQYIYMSQVMNAPNIYYSNVDSLHWKLLIEEHDLESKISNKIKETPCQLTLYLGRAVARKILGKHDLALNDIDAAEYLYNHYWLIHYFRAKYTEELGRYREAILSYGNLIENSPLNHLAYMDRGRVFEILGDIDKSSVDYETATLVENPTSQQFIEEAKKLRKV